MLTFSYDTIGRLREATTGNAGNPAVAQPVSTLTSSYDPVGNRSSLTDRFGLHTYIYDVLSRLIDADHPLASGLLDEAFTYDPVGNRLSSHLSATHTHDAANRLLEDAAFTYTYDANGNLTSKRDKATLAVTTYTYDGEDQLTGVSAPGLTATYRYDGLGRRSEKAVDGVITRYVYDQEDLLLEFDGANVLRARWVHGPGIDEPLLLERDLDQDGALEPTEQFSYHADGLGSIVALTDAAGAVVERYRYTAFGTPTILGPGLDGLMDTGDDVTLACSAYGNPYLFTGREYDCESGLYYYRSRYYDPRTGRFLQEDPVSSSLFEPKSAHRYTYADNNPVTLMDPLGLFNVPILNGKTEKEIADRLERAAPGRFTNSEKTLIARTARQELTLEELTRITASQDPKEQATILREVFARARKRINARGDQEEQAVMKKVEEELQKAGIEICPVEPPQ